MKNTRRFIIFFSFEKVELNPLCLLKDLEQYYAIANVHHILKSPVIRTFLLTVTFSSRKNKNKHTFLLYLNIKKKYIGILKCLLIFVHSAVECDYPKKKLKKK